MAFSYSKWLKLPLQIRVRIADRFKVEKKGSTEVFNDQVIKDGYSVHDLEEALADANLDKVIKDLDKPFTIVPPEDVKKMNEEYEGRTGKKAPVAGEDSQTNLK